MIDREDTAEIKERETDPAAEALLRRSAARRAMGNRGTDEEATGENFEHTDRVVEQTSPSMFPAGVADDPYLPTRSRLSPEDISKIVRMNAPAPGPLFRWYYSLPAAQRMYLYRNMWMITAAFLIVATFCFCLLYLYPILSKRFLPAVGPRPKIPQIFHPASGQLFALIEHRGYDRERFVRGLDCIWVTADPVLNPQPSDEGPYLVVDGMKVASLKVKKNWDGTLRMYFLSGDIRKRKEYTLVVPLKNGGTSDVFESSSVRVMMPGGRLPARVEVGKIRFYDPD